MAFGYLPPSRSVAALPRWARWALFAGVGLLHLLVLLLLLRHPPPPVEAEGRALTVWDVTVPPPPPLPPPPPPPAETEPPVRILPAPAPPGGSDAGAPPATVMPVRRTAIEAPDITPAPLAPTLSAPAFGGAIEASAGAGSGAGTGTAGLGAGKGRGNGIGDGAGGGSLAVARWVTVPGDDELGPYIPMLARKQKLSGQASLACRVMLSRRVRDCAVAKEMPAGSGFGEAARRASFQFRVYPPEVDGRPVNGAWVLVPVNYIYVDPYGVRSAPAPASTRAPASR